MSQIIVNKKKICFTNCDDFRNIQTIGETPMFKRYNSVMGIVRQCIEPKWQNFFAQPDYNAQTGNIDWYIDEWNETPILLANLTGSEYDRYNAIKNEVITTYREAIAKSRSQNVGILADAIKFTDDRCVYCYDDKVTLIAWGMEIDPNKYDPSSVIVHEDSPKKQKCKISFSGGQHGRLESNQYKNIECAKGYILEPKDIPTIITDDGYVFRGWQPDTNNFRVDKDTNFVAQYINSNSVNVEFRCNDNGTICGPKTVKIECGSCLPTNSIPTVQPNAGYAFIGWSSDTNAPIYDNMVFEAQFKEVVNCHFDAGENGVIEGQNNFARAVGSQFLQNEVPKVKPNKGYQFIGWDKSPFDCISENTTYTAQYQAFVPWYKRFWLWLKGLCIWKWLLWLLLLFLLIFLLSQLFDGCDGDHSGCTRDRSGCTRESNAPEMIDVIDDGRGNSFLQDGSGNIFGNPWSSAPVSGIPNGDATPDMNIPSLDLPVGGTPNPIDNNPDHPGYAYLPEHPIELQPIDPGRIVDDEDEYRQIVDDVLNVLIDDDNITITDFANDFKQVYIGNQYQIVYYDTFIKRLQLKVPANEREQIKRELEGRMPEKYHGKIFIWDESLFESAYTPNDSRINELWFLDQIRARQAWDICRGSDKITIAVVDDGFNINHEEFDGKIVSPYNVFTHDDNVSESQYKHGTHVAGMATALMDNSKGISGIAPQCKLMPVKITDNNGLMTITSVLDGVLYAIYKKANVINLSLGMQINLELPIDVQEELINNHFKEEERLWKKVFDIARQNNVVIVVAAGNDDLLAGIEPMHRSDNVIVVAATDKKRQLIKTHYSNYGRYTDVSAPGVDILSSIGQNDYQMMEGTSMAAPIVTGAVALLKSQNDRLTPKQIKAILIKTGLPVSGTDSVGPLIQLDKALECAKNEVQPTQQPSTGDVQILLEWYNKNDIDLYCVDPNGETIWYRNKVARSGGILEIDKNAQDPYTTTPVENIYWPQGQAPKGTYQVYIKYYDVHDAVVDTDYKVTIKYGSTKKTFTGTLIQKNQQQNILTVNYE